MTVSPAARPYWRKLALWVIAAVLGAAVIAFVQVRTLMAPVSAIPEPEATVVVPARASATQIASLLSERGLIRSKWLFLAYARYAGLDKRLKAGEYAISPADSLGQVVDKLTKGQVLTYTFTIPEGYTLAQMADVLANKGLADRERFLRIAAESDFDFPFLEGIPKGANRLEGFLFPDTYRVSRGVTEEQLIEMMLRRFGRVYTDEFRQRASQMGMTTLQVVTLASIIEREAKKAEERPLVSAVFHNRIEKNWYLESCATIQYILGEPKEILTYEDLAIDSPYNTYKYGGLPPGPIAAPGESSLMAALNPADVDYMFFVVKPDGSHAFARTLAEHNANKRKYLPKN
ncbi:hypothetical protein SY88_19795 [Clostridiales bacterium PH28_bin88]|nr:hypothetical protein SY88_19795 [Clostridiales bacterium PH28_bin88]